MRVTLAAVLLDAFGTLFAPVSAGSPAAHLCRLLAADGVQVSPEDAGNAIIAEVGLYHAKFPHVRDEAVMRELEFEASDITIAHLGLTGFPRERMRQHLLDLFRMTAFPDVEPALAALRQRGLALGVVSNYNALLRAHLTELGLADWFCVMVNSADFGRAKPDPGIFLEGVTQLGVTPERVLYVGDDLENDYHGARRAGLHAALLNRDGAPVEQGIPTLSTLAELPEYIDRHLG